MAAPPGYYYLVVNRKTDQGPVPSVARMVHVGTTSDTAEAPQPFPDDPTAPTGGSATSDVDTSKAATTMQQVGEAAQRAPPPASPVRLGQQSRRIVDWLSSWARDEMNRSWASVPAASAAKTATR